MTCLAMAPTMTQTTNSTTSPPDPKLDGQAHINVHYNYSTTKLGRELSTYFVARFNHPYFGPFKCIEGFRLYVQTGCVDDAFRGKTGSEAKAYFNRQIKARALKMYDIKDEEKVLMLAYYARLTQHPVTATLFKESTLPFENYFLWGDAKLPIRPEDSGLLIQSLTTLREYMQAGLEPDRINNDAYDKLRKR